MMIEFVPKTVAFTNQVLCMQPTFNKLSLKVDSKWSSEGWLCIDHPFGKKSTPKTQ